jgi:hypothetical protein
VEPKIKYIHLLKKGGAKIRDILISILKNFWFLASLKVERQVWLLASLITFSHKL